MPDLGNAWHLPEVADPRGSGGMRDPIGAVVAGAELVVRSGNQFAGPGGNPGDQLQDGSAVLAARLTDAGWTEFPLRYRETVANNKYYEARIPGGFLLPGDTLRYLLRIPYGDHDTTFVHAAPGGSAVTADQAVAEAAAFRVGVASPAEVGRWGPLFALPNVPVHAVLLPTGRVLMWGRRTVPGVGDLHVRDCQPFRWDPVSEAVLATSAKPGGGLNLFCAGHAFRADGTLLVAGGHDGADGIGLATTFVYHPDDDRWERVADMDHGRWYPTATTLHDGGVLATSGSYDRAAGPPVDVVNNTVPQVWRDGAWEPVDPLPDDQIFDLYPRIHVGPPGEIAMVGPQARTWYLGADGRWTGDGERIATRRDYAPTAQYRPDRVLYLGGGNDPRPTAACEILDLAAPPRPWRPAAPMAVPRRQHNATVLPDGTVLVTGGTRGPGFNDVGQGEPVHLAELWDPGAADTGGSWRTVAGELRDRCYHSVALLLPDGRVLSGGGGEFQVDVPGGQAPNDPRDTLADAQLYSPPYLFAGPRPTIVAAPAGIEHGSTFPVRVGPGVPAARVTLVRLGSVTHALSMDQRFAELAFTATSTELTVTAPATGHVCPPGPYLLFVLSGSGVPSLAAIVGLTAPAAAPAALDAPAPGIQAAGVEAVRARPVPPPRPTGTAVTVGIDGVCPYGIGACWGGANEALRAMAGVVAVDPVPDQSASTATVRLAGRGLPALDVWASQFHRIANGSYRLRGFEVELTGTVDVDLRLRGDSDRPAVDLVPLGVKIQQRAGGPAPADPAEREAYSRLVAAEPGTRVRVTGPLALVDRRYVLQVRLVEIAVGRGPAVSDRRPAGGTRQPPPWLTAD